MGKHGRKLTAAFVRSVHEPGLYWDEHGLVLRVKPTGYKQWIQRLFIHGKRLIASWIWGPGSGGR